MINPHRWQFATGMTENTPSPTEYPIPHNVIPISRLGSKILILLTKWNTGTTLDKKATWRLLMVLVGYVNEYRHKWHLCLLVGYINRKVSHKHDLPSHAILMGEAHAKDLRGGGGCISILVIIQVTSGLHFFIYMYSLILREPGVHSCIYNTMRTGSYLMRRYYRIWSPHLARDTHHYMGVCRHTRGDQSLQRARNHAAHYRKLRFLNWAEFELSGPGFTALSMAEQPHPSTNAAGKPVHQTGQVVGSGSANSSLFPLPALIYGWGTSRSNTD